MDDGEGAYGEVGDRGDHFHRNEAISAVADEGLLGEDDDDYEDLYNDVNVGENFLQSMRKSEEVGLKSEPVVERMYEQPTPPQPVAVAARVPPPGGLGAGEGATGGDSGYPNPGFRGADVTGPSGSGPMVGGGGGIRVELAQRQLNKVDELEERSANNNVPSIPQGFVQQSNGIAGMNPVNAGPLVGVGNDGLPSQGGVRNTNPVGGSGDVSAGGSGSVVAGAGAGPGAGAGGGGGTMLFVGDLHWWTTDAELEAELCKYGQVKEVKFFDEKASGKSKGYCQVEFFDPAAATACKEGMNGHMFNGRACVVAFASPYSIKRMGEAQMNRNQQMPQSAVSGQGRRGMNDVGPKTGGNNMAAGGNIQGGDNNRGFGRGNWGRGNAQGMGNRGAMGGPMRNRGAGMGGRGLMGSGGGGFGQGMGGAPPLMPPQSMMAQGFDPAFGGPMGRLGGYGGFPGAPAPPFSGLLPSFPPVGGFGMPGVAPHVNPAVFGRGMPMNGMGMMPGSGVEGPNAGMWSDNSMGGWGGEDHGGGRAGESSYGEEAASEHQYGEAAHDRGGWQNSSKEKERGTERDWSGSSDRRYQDDREMVYERDAPRDKEMGRDREWSQRRHREDRDSGWERPERDRDHDRDGERSRDRERERSRDRVRERDRDRERERERERERHREDRDRYSDHHRHRDHDPEHDDDYHEKGRPSRSHTKSRLSQEDDHRSRSREADYGKRRRLTSE